MQVRSVSCIMFLLAVGEGAPCFYSSRSSLAMAGEINEPPRTDLAKAPREEIQQGAGDFRLLLLLKFCKNLTKKQLFEELQCWRNQCPNFMFSSNQTRDA